MKAISLLTIATVLALAPHSAAVAQETRTDQGSGDVTRVDTSTPPTDTSPRNDTPPRTDAPPSRDQGDALPPGPMPEPPTDEPGNGGPSNDKPYRDDTVSVLDAEVSCKMRYYGEAGDLFGLEFQNVGSTTIPAGSNISLIMPDGSVQNFYVSVDTPPGWYVSYGDVFEGGFPENWTCSPKAISS